jgi:plasmid maintenance system antidote protein VapI
MNLQRAYDLHEARQRVDVSSIKPMKVALAS